MENQLTRTVNKQLLLNSWQIGSGSNTNFTQSLQNPIQNARAIHFLSFVMPQMIRPFTLTDGFFSFYQDGLAGSVPNPAVTPLKQVAIDTNQFFFSIAGFIAYMNSRFVANADVRIKQLVFAQETTYGTGYGTMRLTLKDTGGTVAPAGFNYAVPFLEGNYKMGYALPSYVFQAQNAVVFADGFPNVIQRTNSIRIQTNLTGSTHSANRDYNTVFTVPVNVNPGNMLTFNSPYRIQFPSICPLISEVSISLLDDDGNQLNIPDNCYMSCVLAIECDP
jgi:hypothetical protein